MSDFDLLKQRVDILENIFWLPRIHELFQLLELFARGSCLELKFVVLSIVFKLVLNVS